MQMNESNNCPQYRFRLVLYGYVFDIRRLTICELQG